MPKNPPVEATPTDIAGWKKVGPQLSGTTLTFPSGVSARVRLPGASAFMAMGFIPNSLLPMMQDSVEGKSVDDDKLMAKVMQNPEMLQDMMVTLDGLTVHCFLEPKVLPAPTEADVRDPELLYVDEIDLEDKMFLFGAAVGGTKDLETFRGGQVEGVEPVQRGKNVVKPTKRTGGTAKRKS